MNNVVKHFVGHAYDRQLQEQGYSSITQDDNRLTPDGLSSATSMLAHHNTSADQGRELQLNIQKAKATIHDNSLEEVRRKRRAVMAANTNPLTAGIQGEQRFFGNHLSPTPIASKTVVSTVLLEKETLQMEIAMAESLTEPVKESRAVAGGKIGRASVGLHFPEVESRGPLSSLPRQVPQLGAAVNEEEQK
jgi:hypothetical protein